MPLPKIDELYALLKGAKVFSTLDLRSGYYHIALTEDSKAKTAFVTPFGKHQFEVVPFGLRQAPAFFQQLISAVLKDVHFAYGYLDDIIIFSDNEEQHLEHLEIIFQKLIKAGLKLKESKCNFFKSHIQYLGHTLSAEGISPLPEKCQAINDMPPPRNVKECQIFMGLIGYYRKFVPRFSDMARPITNLTRKKVDWDWSDTCTLTFNMLKEFLFNEPVLIYPDPNKDYYLFTDASKFGWAGVLTQLLDKLDGIPDTKKVIYHPVQYVSGLFRGSQLGWAALTKEAYAIYRNVKRLSFYLELAKTYLRSDHLPLKKFLYRNTLNSKVNNWAVELETYNIVFEWIKGKDNVLADVLSRLIKIDPEYELKPEDQGQEFGHSLFDLPENIKTTPEDEINYIDMIIYTQADMKNSWMKIDTEIGEMKVGVEIKLPIRDDKLIRLQREDKKCKELIKKYEKGQLDPHMYSMPDGILHKRVSDNKQNFITVVLPKVLIEPALVLAHEAAGHNGSTRTYMALRRLYYWKGMKNHVYRHCKSCVKCRVINQHTVQVPSLHFAVPKSPMQQIAVDLIGYFDPPSSKGNKYALTAVCLLTGFTFCVPIPNKDKHTVIKAYMDHIYAVAVSYTHLTLPTMRIV